MSARKLAPELSGLVDALNPVTDAHWVSKKKCEAELRALLAVARAAEVAEHSEGWGEDDFECEHGASLARPCPDAPGDCGGDALRNLMRALARLRKVSGRQP